MRGDDSDDDVNMDRESSATRGSIRDAAVGDDVYKACLGGTIAAAFMQREATADLAAAQAQSKAAAARVRALESKLELARAEAADARKHAADCKHATDAESAQALQKILARATADGETRPFAISARQLGHNLYLDPGTLAREGFTARCAVFNVHQTTKDGGKTYIIQAPDAVIDRDARTTTKITDRYYRPSRVADVFDMGDLDDDDCYVADEGWVIHKLPAASADARGRAPPPPPPSPPVSSSSVPSSSSSARVGR